MTVVSLLADWSKATERIDERAKKIQPRRVALLALAAIPFVVCFLIYFAWKFVWTIFTWFGAACVEGWTTAKNVEGQRAAAKRGEPWVS